MLRQSHVSSEFEQYSFHGEVTLPLSKAGQLGRINLSTSLVNAWNVDTRDELNRRRVVRVIGAAVDVDTVYPVLMDAVRRSKDCSVPVAHHHIFSIRETIGACLCSQTLLTLLQLFEESKIPGNFRRHCERRICLDRTRQSTAATAERSSELPRDDNNHVMTISALAFPGDATPDTFVDRPTLWTKSRFLAIFCLETAYKLEGFDTLALLQGVRINVVKLPLF